MRRDLPTGTFLFTDVEGSTKLLHELGAEAYAEALAEQSAAALAVTLGGRLGDDARDRALERGRQLSLDAPALAGSLDRDPRSK